MNITLTPTPIPMDDVPVQFQNYMFHFFHGLLKALQQIEIPFTHVNCYQVLLGTLAVSAISLAIALIYGKGGARDRE